MPRYALISDIHANLHALCAVMEHALQTVGCTEIACMGDVVGYNAYPKECLDYIRSLGCAVVKGNHDDDVFTANWGRMNPVARQAVEWTRAQLDEDRLLWLGRLQFQRLEKSLFTMVHSGLDQPKAWNYIINANDATASLRRQFSALCFHGHTHVPKVYMWDGQRATEDKASMELLRSEGAVCVPLVQGMKYFINVGAVGQPRDGDPRACYAVYDSEAAIVTFYRVPYDVEAAQQAVLQVGLPPVLAERLAQGR